VAHLTNEDTIDWNVLSDSEEQEILDTGYKLLDLLLEHSTLKNLDSNLADQTKKMISKPSASDTPKIRIELAT